MTVDPTRPVIKAPKPRVGKVEKKAAQMLSQIARDPEEEARLLLTQRASSLSPDDPYYIDNLDKLDEIVFTAPGYNADSSLAMLAAGIDPSTEIGQALAAAQQQAEANRLARDEQMAEWRDQSQQQNVALQFATSALGHAFGLASSVQQTVVNLGKVNMGAFQIASKELYGGGTVLDAATKGWEQWTEHIDGVLYHTDIGQLYGNEGEVNWYGLDADSEGAAENVAWSQQALGMYDEKWDEKVLEPTIKPNGEIVYEEKIINRSPSTLGQGALSAGQDLTGNWVVEPGSTIYSLVSGVTDLATYTADPLMWTPSGWIKRGLMKAENVIRKGVGSAGAAVGSKTLKEIKAPENLRGTADDVAEVIGTTGKRAVDADEILSKPAKKQESVDDAAKLADDVEQALIDLNDTFAGLVKASSPAAATLKSNLDNQALQVATKVTQDNAIRTGNASKQLSIDALVAEIGDVKLRQSAVKLMDELKQSKALPKGMTPAHVEEVAEALAGAANNLFAKANNLVDARNVLDVQLANASKDMLVEAQQLAQRMNYNPPTTVDDAADFLKKQAGQVEGADFTDVDKALQWLTRGSDPMVQKLLNAFVQIKDPGLIFDMTRGKINVKTMNELADAETVDQVRAILARGMTTHFDESIGQMRAIRTAAQVRGGGRLNPYAPKTLSIYGKVFGEPGLKMLQYQKQLRKAKVPWSGMQNINDREGMVELIHNSGTYLMKMNRPFSFTRKNTGLVNAFDDAISPEVFRREWTNKMMRAETAQGRRKVWEDFNREMIERIGRNVDLSDEEIGILKRKLGLYYSEQAAASALLAEVRGAARNGENPIFNGKEIKSWQDLAFLEAHLSNTVMSPDWDELIRLGKSHKAAMKRIDNARDPHNTAKIDTATDRLREGLDTTFDRVWRAGVITFRGAYLFRNMADIQLRMYLKGHPSAFTNPMGIMALAFSRLPTPESWSAKKLDWINRKIAKSLDEKRVADIDARGNKLWDDADDDFADISDFANPWLRMMEQRNVSHIDVGQAAKSGTPPKQKNFAWSRIGVDGYLPQDYWKNLWQEVQLQAGGFITIDVLRVMDGHVMPHIQRVMDEAAQAGEVIDAKEAVVRYFAYHPTGRAHLDELRDGSSGFAELVQKPELDNLDSLRKYLWGDDEISVASRWGRLTFGQDQDIVDLILRNYPKKDDLATRAARKKYESEQQAAIKLLESRATALYNVTKSKRDDGRVLWQQDPNNPLPSQFVQAPKTVTEHKAFQMFDESLTWFYAKSGRFENAFGYLPEARYAKWDAIASLATALNREDADELMKNARKALGGGKTNSWSWHTLNKIEKAVSRTKGDGGFSLEDLDYVSNVRAVKEVERTFYNAMNRNQFAHALRVIFPFAQPWFNTLETWGKLALENPQQVYKAGVVYDSAMGRDSNWLWDDPSNPNDSWFYKDPTTGTMMVGVPFLGPSMALLASAGTHLPLTPMSGAPGIDQSMLSGGMTLQSMNLALQSGGGPGAGPIFSMAMDMLEKTGWYNSHVPDAVKDFIAPQRAGNPDQPEGLIEMFTPAWAGGVLASMGIGGYKAKTKRYLGPALHYTLANDWDLIGDRDPDTGERLPLTQEQMMLALRMAEGRASALMFGRSLMQNLTPGAPLPQVLTEVDDGRVMANVVLYQEYQAGIDKHGDPDKALTDIANKYGHDAIWAMMPTRASNLPATEGAWEMVKDHPEIAEKYGDVVSLLNPGGGYSARFSAWSREVGRNPQMSSEDMARGINTMLGRAQQARLEYRFALPDGHPEKITFDELEYRLDKMKDDYYDVPKKDWDTDYSKVLRSSVSDAALEPVLMEAYPDVTTAINTYEDYYAWLKANVGRDNERDDFKADSWAQVREALRFKGEELGRKYPKFKLVFMRVYWPELKEDQFDDWNL